MQKAEHHNPIVEMVQYQLEASMELTDAVFSGTEKIERAMRDATHQAVDGQINIARAVVGINNPAELVDVRTALATRPDKAIKCQRQIMMAFAEMQSDIGKSIQHYMERFSQAAMAGGNEAARPMERALEKSGQPVFNPMSSMLSVWENAFREAASFANRNMMAARSTMESAANAATEAVAHTVEAVESAGNEGAEHAERKHAVRRRH